jgi:hypothetical protein
LLFGGPLAAICDVYGATEDCDLLVWSSETIADSGAIYGRPHFDRRHQLKTFIYLDDVSLDDGPTRVALEAPDRFHERWLDAWRVSLGMRDAADDAVLQAARLTPERSRVYNSVACELPMDHDELVPLIGSAGTVVVFDTSLAHCGGLVQAEGRRRTVRRHTLLA